MHGCEADRSRSSTTRNPCASSAIPDVRKRSVAAAPAAQTRTRAGTSVPSASRTPLSVAATTSALHRKATRLRASARCTACSSDGSRPANSRGADSSRVTVPVSGPASRLSLARTARASSIPAAPPPATTTGGCSSARNASINAGTIASARSIGLMGSARPATPGRSVPRTAEPVATESTSYGRTAPPLSSTSSVSARIRCPAAETYRTPAPRAIASRSKESSSGRYRPASMPGIMPE